jgi:hypothetical protein
MKWIKVNWSRSLRNLKWLLVKSYRRKEEERCAKETLCPRKTTDGQDLSFTTPLLLFEMLAGDYLITEEERRITRLLHIKASFTQSPV